MINRVKNMLGIESVRLRLEVPDAFRIDSGLLAGTLEFESIRPHVVTEVNLWLEETYRRGRGGNKLISTFELGRISLVETVEIKAGEVLQLPFELRFAERRSRIEQAPGATTLLRPLVYALKKSVAASSAYMLHARANVAGVKLAPTTRLLL